MKFQFKHWTLVAAFIAGASAGVSPSAHCTSSGIRSDSRGPCSWWNAWLGFDPRHRGNSWFRQDACWFRRHARELGRSWRLGPRRLGPSSRWNHNWNGNWNFNRNVNINRNFNRNINVNRQCECELEPQPASSLAQRAVCPIASPRASLARWIWALALVRRDRRRRSFFICGSRLWWWLV